MKGKMGITLYLYTVQYDKSSIKTLPNYNLANKKECNHSICGPHINENNDMYILLTFNLWS